MAPPPRLGAAASCAERYMVQLWFLRSFRNNAAPFDVLPVPSLVARPEVLTLGRLSMLRILRASTHSVIGERRPNCSGSILALL